MLVACIMLLPVKVLLSLLYVFTENSSWKATPGGYMTIGFLRRSCDFQKSPVREVYSSKTQIHMTHTPTLFFRVSINIAIYRNNVCGTYF